MCDNPKILYIKSSTGKRYRLFGTCGKCPSCMNSARAQLVQRFKIERETSPYVFFLTLTYTDSNLKPLYYKPFYWLYNKYSDYLAHLKRKYISGCANVYDKFLLKKSDFMDFTKCFQKYLKVHFGFLCKFYLTGEYGTVGKRPHGHAVLFFKQDFDPYYLKEVCRQIWAKGQVSLFRCTDAGLNYVAKHQCKYDCGTKLQNKLAPIFATQSIKNGGIGYNMRYDKEIITNYFNDIHYGRIKDTRYAYALPRYVLKYLHPESFSDSELEELEHRSFETFKEKLTLSGYDLGSTYKYVETNEKYKSFFVSRLEQNRNNFLRFHQHRFNNKYISYRRNLSLNNICTNE